MSDESDNTAGLLTVMVFVLIVWVLRALFSAADQSK